MSQSKQNQILTSAVSRRSFLRFAGMAGIFGASVTFLGGCAPDAEPAGSTSSGDGVQVNAVVAQGNPPYCYLDGDGNIVGYDYDVLKAVADRLDGYSFKFDSMDFNTMVTACETGSADVVSCQLVPNDERKEKFLFCEEPFCLSPMVFAVADPNIKTLDDMAGKTVLSNATGYEYGMLQAYNKKYPDKAVELVTTSSSSNADAFKMIASGQVDATLCYDGGFDTINEEAGTGLYKTNVVLCESTYFMFNKSQEELCNAVNDVLKEMKSDGSLGKIAEQDLGTDVFTTYADALTDNQITSE